MEEKQNEPKSSIAKITRRRFLVSSVLMVTSAALAACGINLGGGATTQPEGNQATASESPKAANLEPTPACGSPEEMTPAVTEGPYFTPNSPEKSSLLEQGMKGTKLTLVGYVVSTTCTPVAHALLDFWQADADGQYDNKGFTLRGHQYTDDKGKFTLETIVPGLYPGRTRHIHVKVQAPNGPVLTSQLFFPNEAGNAKDGIYNKALLMEIKSNADGSQSGAYQFVVKV
jgi:protocatechuate 3,4-dioxygenase beta subunit